MWLFVLLFLVISGVFLFLGGLSEAALKYKTLLSERVLINDSIANDEKSTNQLRKNISKQILYTNEGKRLQLRLSGLSSDFTYSKKEKGIAESIKGLSCQMAGDDSLTVDSGVAVMDEKGVSLTGDVKVNHALGRISAHRFSMSRTPGEEGQGLLKMSGNVLIQWNGGGELACEEAEIDCCKMSGVFVGSDNASVVYRNGENEQLLEMKSNRMDVLLKRDPQCEKRMSIQSLKAPYATECVLKKDHQECTVHCPGSLDWNCDKGEVVLTGTTSEQVYIDEEFGSFFADQVILKQFSFETHFQIVEIAVEGNISLQNRYDKVTGVSSSPLHVALADKMDYQKKDREMVLSALPGRNVLLFDAVNHMQMSASQLVVKQNEDQTYPVIQGKGNVRFTLMENELSHLKGQFSVFEAFKKKDKKNGI